MRAKPLPALGYDNDSHATHGHCMHGCVFPLPLFARYTQQGYKQDGALYNVDMDPLEATNLLSDPAHRERAGEMARMASLFKYELARGWRAREAQGQLNPPKDQHNRGGSDDDGH